MAKKVKRDVRFDSRHVRLKVGETEKVSGGYEYRWTSKDGKRHSICRCDERNQEARAGLL